MRDGVRSSGGERDAIGDAERQGSDSSAIAEPAPAASTLHLGTVVVLLAATAVLYTSQGLTHTVVPLRLAVGTSAGLVTAAYFAGFAAGAFLGGPVIRHVGHIRAFGALTAIVVVLVLLLPLLPMHGAWMVLRTLHGAGIAGLALIVESWLTATTSAAARGRVLAAYTTAVYTGFGIGPLLLSVYSVASWEVFSIGAALLAGAGVPVLLSRIEAPPLPDPAVAISRPPIGIPPLSLVVGAASGASSAALTALVPLFGVGLGLDGAGVGLLMSVMMLGGLALQWPIGHLSDRRDRRVVIVAVCALSATIALALLSVEGLPTVAVFVLLAALEGTMLTLYPMSLAYANDCIGPGVDSTDVAAGLLLAYGAGSVLGPLAGGFLSIRFGPQAVFVLAGMLLGAATLFGVARLRHERRTAVEHQVAYAAVPHSTPGVFELEAGTVPEEDFEAHQLEAL